MTDAWFIAYARPRAELTAVQELRELGYEAYSPAETVWRRHARSRTAVRRALFPRYLFVAVDHPRQAFPRVDSIQRFLASGAGPLELAFDHVDQLRQAEALGLFDRTVERKITFAAGQPVRIVGGPFVGFMAEVMAAHAGEGRVRVLLKGAFAGVVNIGARKLEAA